MVMHDDKNREKFLRHGLPHRRHDYLVWIALHQDCFAYIGASDEPSARIIFNGYLGLHAADARAIITQINGRTTAHRGVYESNVPRGYLRYDSDRDAITDPIPD